MAINTTTTHSNQIQIFLDKVLLEHAVHTLILDQFAMKSTLPSRAGTKSVRFYKKMVADASRVQTATEGVPPTTPSTQSYTAVDVTLVQLLEYFQWTDILEATALLRVISDGVATMGEDCALKMDDVTLAAIAHATTGGAKRYAGGAATFAALDALTPANGKVTGDDVLNALTALRIAKAPKIDGEYIGIAGPRVMRDLMDDTTWVNIKTYSTPEGIYKGEAGTFYGVRFILTTNEWCEDATEGTRDVTPDADSNWLTVITGKQGYGVVHLDGMSPFSPKVMICDKPEKVDPANQYVTATWKAYYQSAVLDPTWVVALRSKSTFGS